MKYFRFYMTGFGEKVIGIIKANNLMGAEKILCSTYEDWKNWNIKIDEMELDKEICEIYYGG